MKTKAYAEPGFQKYFKNKTNKKQLQYNKNKDTKNKSKQIEHQ